MEKMNQTIQYKWSRISSPLLIDYHVLPNIFSKITKCWDLKIIFKGEGT